MAHVKNAAEEREVYTPPCVVKMRDLNPGDGQVTVCSLSGSGALGDCKVGNLPGSGCYAGNGVD